MQARLNRAGVTDAGDEKNSIRQDGDRKSRKDKNFHVVQVPGQSSRIHDQISEHGRARGDDGGGGHGVATRKSHVGVQEKKQDSDRIFDHHDNGDEGAVAKVRLAEEVCFRKVDRWDKRVRKRGDA